MLSVPIQVKCLAAAQVLPKFGGMPSAWRVAFDSSWDFMQRLKLFCGRLTWRAQIKGTARSHSGSLNTVLYLAATQRMFEARGSLFCIYAELTLESIHKNRRSPESHESLEAAFLHVPLPIAGVGTYTFMLLWSHLLYKTAGPRPTE